MSTGAVMAAEAAWHLYLLRCDGGRLYTGISTDPERRLRQHRGLAAGARSTRGRHPELVYRVRIGDRSLALRAEARVKRLTASRKRSLVAEAPSPARLLAFLGLDETVTPAAPRACRRRSAAG